MGANAVTTTYDFTAGEVLTAAQMDNVNCGVPTFATTVTRDAAFGGTGEKVLAEGQMCYIEAAPNRLQIYDGATWRPIDLDAWTAYTPTVTASTGSFTTVSATGAYAVVGKSLFIRFKVTITTNGTASGGVVITSPVNITGDNGASIGSARELAVNGGMNNVLIANSTQISIITPTNGYPGGTGYVLAGFAVTEVA